MEKPIEEESIDDEQMEKDLSTYIAFYRGNFNFERNEINCSHYNNKNQKYRVEIEDLMRLMFKEPFTKQKIASKTDFLKCLQFFNPLPVSFDALFDESVSCQEQTLTFQAIDLACCSSEKIENIYLYHLMQEELIRHSNEVKKTVELITSYGEGGEQALAWRVAILKKNRKDLTECLSTNSRQERVIELLQQPFELRHLLE